ncbi:MAG: NAD-dependent epimerase/dehydratase family protein [Verrucomicrobiota bacterium]
MRLNQPNRSSIPHVRRVFVTGAAGFIGSHLVERLLAENYQVVGFDNLSGGHQHFLGEVWNHPELTMMEGDILDADLMASAMEGCDLVCHLAGNTNLWLDIRQPTLDLSQNTMGTLQVLQATLNAKVPRFFFISSSEVYGHTTIEPVTENTSYPRVDTLYGTSKLACEGLIQTYARNFHLQSTVARVGAVTGPRARRNLIADIYRALVLSPEEFQMAVSPSQRHSFIHVQDVIDAAIHLLGRHSTHHQEALVEIFNVASNETARISDVVRLICRCQGLYPSVRLAEESSASAGREKPVLLDTERLRQTGWQHRYPLQQSISETLEWLRENHWALGDPYAQMPAPAAKARDTSTPVPSGTLTPAPPPAEPAAPATRSKWNLISSILPNKN